jgi:hypothetical protein
MSIKTQPKILQRKVLVKKYPDKYECIIFFIIIGNGKCSQSMLLQIHDADQ